MLLVRKTEVDMSVKAQNYFRCISHQRQVETPTLEKLSQDTGDRCDMRTGREK